MAIILGQDGHGRGEKLSAGLRADVIRGCVFSPHYQCPGTYEAAMVEECAARGMALFDPEVYLHTIPAAKRGRLGDWAVLDRDMPVDRHLQRADLRRARPAVSATAGGPRIPHGGRRVAAAFGLQQSAVQLPIECRHCGRTTLAFRARGGARPSGVDHRRRASLG